MRGRRGLVLWAVVALLLWATAASAQSDPDRNVYGPVTLPSPVDGTSFFLSEPFDVNENLAGNPFYEFVLVLENGLGRAHGERPMRRVEVTLNDRVVFREFRPDAVSVEVVPLRDEDNVIEVLGQGVADAGLRFRIIATPRNRFPLSGRSIAPYVVTVNDWASFLTLVNAGPGRMGYTVQLFEPNGDQITCPTGPHVLEPHQMKVIDIDAYLQNGGCAALPFGSVQLTWASLRPAELAGFATLVKYEDLDGDGIIQADEIVIQNTVPLHHLPPERITAEKAASFFE